MVKNQIKGTVRIDEQKEFHEIISCHDARRTFISCSLAMGIPENFVRRCSGNKDLRTMAPYMGVGIESQTLEMDKWNKSQYRSEIIIQLDKMTENEFSLISQLLQNKNKLLAVIE